MPSLKGGGCCLELARRRRTTASQGRLEIISFKSLHQFTTEHWGILGITALGFLLRLYRIDYQSLWYDEAFSLTVSQLPFAEMTNRLIQDFVHPPLHSYMLHAWFRLFGFGSLQARLLSATFGTLAIIMIYLLAHYLFDRRTALLSALLLALSQFSVMYAQEARSYAQLLFFVLSSSYLFLMALRQHYAPAWWGFVSSASLMVYTHYFGVLVVATLLLYACLYKKRYTLPALWLIGGAGVAIALYTPWVMSGIAEQALHSPKTLPTEQPPYFATHWWTFFDTISRFNNDRVAGLLAPPPWWSFFAGGLLFTVPALLALRPLMARAKAGRPDRVQQEGISAVTMLWLLPVLLAISLGTFNIQYSARYVAFCAAPYYVLVARGISGLKTPRVFRTLIVLMLAYSAYSLHANYFSPYKEDYREALAYLAREYMEGDCCIFLPFGEVPLEWSVYHGDHPGLRTTRPDAIASSQARCDRVWLVGYHRVEWAIKRVEEGQQTLATTHSKIEERQYFWVNVGLYLPRGHEAHHQ